MDKQITMKKSHRNHLATGLGSLTTILLAAEFVDFDNMNYKSVNAYVDLLLVLLPAIGGLVSEVKGKIEPLPSKVNAD